MNDVTDVDALENKTEDNPDKIEILPNPRDAIFASIEDRHALNMRDRMVENDEDEEEIKAQMEGIDDPETGKPLYADQTEEEVKAAEAKKAEANEIDPLDFVKSLNQ